MRDWLSYRVTSSPDATALIRAEDGEAWTYAELDRLVAETAGRLAARGIGAGDRLGVLMPPYVGYVGLIHAAMRIGATLVPLGERLTERELSERVERVDLTALVCSEKTETDALAATDGAPVLSVDEPTEPSVAGLHDVDPRPIELPVWSDTDRLCILFTSGTAGRPKPVQITAGNVYSSAIASAFRLGIDPDDRWLVSLSLHHMGGLAPIYRSTLYGTTVVLRGGFDPGGTADDIDRFDVTGVSLVPTMLKRTLDSRGTLADSLRVVLLGGAPAPDDLLERCRDYSIPVYPTYGMTETASQIATATPAQARYQLGTVGRPLFGTDLTVVDDRGLPVESGETGEIVVDGPVVTPGYYDDPAANEAAFGEYGLHTDDVGMVDDDGYVYVLNRLDDRIITGGENVEPGEVAGVLREHPSIEEAAVVGLDDETWGERVGALLVADSATSDADSADSDADSADSDADSAGSNSDQVDTDELLSFARERLAGFKLPRTVAFTDELPRTVSGTVDRDAVRETLRSHGVEPDRPAAEFAAAGFETAEPKSGASDSEGSGASVEADDEAASDDAVTETESGTAGMEDESGTPTAESDGSERDGE